MVQNHEGFNFVTGKPSAKLKDLHVTIPSGAPSNPPYAKADIRDGYVRQQVSPVYIKSEKYELFRNKVRLVLHTETLSLIQNSTIWLVNFH